MTVYSDFNSDFSLNNLPPLLTDAQAVQNKLLNLLRCMRGSRYRQPEFGTLLPWYVHEPCDDETADAIISDIIPAIRRWVPEIQLRLSHCFIAPNDQGNGFQCQISYYIPQLQVSDSLNFNATR